MSFSSILYIVVGIFVVSFIFDMLTLYKAINVSKNLSESAVAFERIIPGATTRFLVAGDSTAVGTGTTNPDFSTAGRLAADFPGAEVVVIAENGLKLEELLEKLQSELTETDTFNASVLQIGANDIVRFTGYSDIEKSLRLVIDKVSASSEQVVILHSGNIGDASIFPWYLRAAYGVRSRNVRDIYIRVIDEYENVTYVDLFDPEFTKRFETDEQEFYAIDQFHLSDEGYRLWYEEIKKNLDLQ